MMKKLINTANRALLGLKCKAHCFVQSFKEDERGVSPIVATVLTVLMAVLLAVLFWDFIAGWLTKIIEKIGADPIKAPSSIVTK